ncbi:unnamed protein product [Fraxinus pennsylvanica]|uniref:Uncharacterized protein n=1 Tax=Fraxinus pennsylvanica TaxID=56036 RepID=A0AAD2DYR1_9LAMI|nr:unnamed protein product [Fraxinus pennsylvanica]
MILRIYGQLVDSNALLIFEDKFVELLDGGNRERVEKVSVKREILVKKDMEFMVAMNKETILKCFHDEQNIHRVLSHLSTKYGLYPEAQSQWMPNPPVFPPLCAAQITSVNLACCMLPLTHVPPPKPSPPSPPSSDKGRRHGHRHEHEHKHEHEHEREHEHGHGHGQRQRQRLRHGHGHGHGHKHGHGETSIEDECCLWLKAVDRVCVCGLLMYLPSFLSRPLHNYTLAVDDLCKMTFQCGSSWMEV